MPRPRVLLFGIRCRFTEIVTARLVQSVAPSIALILPGPPTVETPIPIPARASQLSMAGASLASAAPQLPTYLVGQLGASVTIDLIEHLAPDLIVVACFPRLIPRAIYERARLGAVNIHPSLLPEHRGPDPLFWIMRDGGAGCGVTIHALASRFDSGDILAQRAIQYPDGVRESELESRLASVGAEMTLAIIDRAQSGTLSGRGQDERLAGYESWPQLSDYAVDTNRPARDAWNFVRGVAERGAPVRVETGHDVVFISDAVEYGDDRDPPPAGEGQMAIRFNPGWLLASIDRGSRH